MNEGWSRRLSALRLACAAGRGRYSQVAGAALVAWLPFCWLAGLPIAKAQDVIMYPMRGQAPEQQTQDRYECYLWAVQQSGFDPTQATAAPAPPPYAPPPAVTTSPLTGATRGAAIGAIGGAIGGNAGKGAAIGAATGALIGGIRRNEQRRQQQAYYEQQQVYQAQRSGSSTAQQSAYTRALRACLQGRGYTVG